VHSVATDADGEVGVLLRVLHSVQQHLLVQHIPAGRQASRSQ
jgi:hypothetical protein